MTAAAPCWRCRLDRLFFWVEIASMYATVAACAFLAGAVWALAQVPA